MSKAGKTKTADTPQVLLEHHLKALRLPTFLGEYEKHANAPPPGSITRVICYGWPSWS